MVKKRRALAETVQPVFSAIYWTEFWGSLLHVSVVFRTVTTYYLVSDYQHFDEIKCLHLQDVTSQKSKFTFPPQ
jgi:hypothetical protein